MQIYAAKNAEVLTCHEEPLEPISPHSGWVEFDPARIWHSVRDCIERAVQNLELLEIDLRDMVAVGMCNQCEKSVLWDRQSGQALCNAIGWCDTRTSAVLGGMLARMKGKINFLKAVCGLPFVNCFSAVKVRWMLDQGIEEKEVLFGTLDSWVEFDWRGDDASGDSAC